ncbi:MAG: hypothetical protein Q9220_001138 [cf. Caloplaca sp. 1 TL-2023]
MNALSYILFTLCHLLPLVLSASNPTSFCKCTCGSNSTIIPLDAPSTPNLLNTRSFAQQQPYIQQAGDNDVDDSKDKESKEDQNGKDEGKEEDRKEYRKKTCNDCNKQYCLSQHLHICEGKGADDVFTTCFQRDSRKDEAVVFIFIIATAGLLGWAAVKPWVEKWIHSARERRSYIPVAGEGDT